MLYNYIHMWTNTHEKDIDPFILSSYELNQYTTALCQYKI